MRFYFYFTKANILIDQNRHARLADFGLLTIISDTTIATSSSCVKGGTMRWMSPELLNPDQFGFKDSRPTKESDCYALGMVVLEVLSGRPPFASDKDVIVLRKILDGERPGRPGGSEGAWFTDRLWRMLDLCWATRPKSRPTVEAVLERLERISKAWEPPSQEVDWDVGTDKDDPNRTIVSDYFAWFLVLAPPVPHPSSPRLRPLRIHSIRPSTFCDLCLAETREKELLYKRFSDDTPVPPM